MVVVVAFFVGNTTPTLPRPFAPNFLNQSDFTDIISPSQKHLVEHTPWMPDTAAVALTLLSAALLPLLLEWLMNFEPFYLCRNTDCTALTDCFSSVCGDRTQHVMGTRALQNIIITPLHDFMNLLRFNNATLTLARSTVTASPRHCHYCDRGTAFLRPISNQRRPRRERLSLLLIHGFTTDQDFPGLPRPIVISTAQHAPI